MRARTRVVLLVMALLGAASILGAADEAAAQRRRGRVRERVEERQERRSERRGDDREDQSEEESLARLGLDVRRDSERLISGARRLIRIRQQMGIGGRGDIGRYRDAVEAYARFLKRDNLALIRDAVLRAELAYSRLDRAWVDEVAARLRTGGGVLDLVTADPGKLAESVAIAKEIAQHLEDVQRLVGEGEQREAELDRSFRNLVRLGEEARRVHVEVERLSPPPGVLLLSEEIRALFETEVRPLRVREESLRTLRTRLSERGMRPVHRELLSEMRDAVRKVFAIQRAVEEERDR